MPSLYLIRHGRPALTGVLLGQCDPDLDRQSVPDIQLEVPIVYTSTLKRAKQSAALLFPQVKDVCALSDLNEISYGDWDGKTWDEILVADEALAQAKLLDWTGVTPPNGQPWDTFVLRVRKAFQQMKAGPLPAAVVAHEGVNAILANLLEGGSVLEFRQDYWQVNRYECS